MLLVAILSATSFTLLDAPARRYATAGSRAASPLLQDEPGALAKPGSTLEQALGSLPEGEKYNAVLLSLISKGEGTSSAASALELVQEMSLKRLRLSKGSLKALLDAAIEGEMTQIIESLGAAQSNGACRAYATRELRLPVRPKPATLAALAPVPTDGRAAEVGAATAVSLGAGALLLLEVADLFDFLLPGVDLVSPPLPLVGGLIAAAWGFDRYARSGELFALVSRGLTRLFSRDLQRECALESASFVAGYLLGLPCCAYAPTAFKPLEMLTDAAAPIESSVGAPARLIDRILIWLYAPAALEASRYSELLQADPSLAATFLAAARRREAAIGVDVLQGGWSADEDDERLRWAYAEARRLVRCNQPGLGRRAPPRLSPS